MPALIISVLIFLNYNATPAYYELIYRDLNIYFRGHFIDGNLKYSYFEACCNNNPKNNLTSSGLAEGLVFVMGDHEINIQELTPELFLNMKPQIKRNGAYSEVIIENSSSENIALEFHEKRCIALRYIAPSEGKSILVKCFKYKGKVFYLPSTKDKLVNIFGPPSSEHKIYRMP